MAIMITGASSMALTPHAESESTPINPVIPIHQWTMFSVATYPGVGRIDHVVDTHAANGILENYEFAVSSLFKNLHIPALRALSVSSVARSQYNPVAELGVMPRAVLAITTLALGSRFGLFDSHERNTSKLTRSGVETFWDGTSK
ncbi:hypothetical protein BJ912DRAFT_931121 [Pholiota molesta]|nr:hypothetical protein BJ912DRAFT_931121 [Pholiota molesta]